MLLPELQEIPSTRSVVDVFGGYNRKLRISDSEFYDMKNMTSKYYPVLSPRDRRGVYAQGVEAKGMISKDQLGYVSGSDFVYGGKVIPLGLSTEAQSLPKTLVSFGAYVIIFPDKIYVNTADPTEWGKIECSMEENQSLSIRWCDLEGNEYPTGQFHLGDTPPLTPEDGMFWIRAVGAETEIQQYYALNGVWAAPANLYLKLMFSSTDIPFQAHDTVAFRYHWTEEDPYVSTQFTVVSVGENYVITDGTMRATRADSKPVQAELQKSLPMMDYVIECDNRLWGCYYGMVKGKLVNEIYASALGDFKNWSVYQGTSMDSYAASCGTDGPWTGAAQDINGTVCFFKENYIHRVYGNYPANFQIQTLPCAGVQSGSGRSLVSVGGVLYYKGVHGVYAYDGSLPVEISNALGTEHYGNAIGGCYRNKYYICMEHRDRTRSLFVYDTEKGLWHKEDAVEISAFCTHDGELYFLNADGDICTVEGTQEQPVKWFAESGVIGAETPDHKYLSRITLRMQLPPGSEVRVWVQYDSVGDWKHIASMRGYHLRSFSLPLRPRRCDHLRLRIEGEGDAKIYSMTKTMEQGSDYG